MNLRIPGPTPCPDDVLEAMGRQMINHRSPEFADIIGRVTAGLSTLFETKHDVYCLSASGTGSMEAMVVNFLSPGDKLLVVSIGVFGDRFATIAKTYGAEVDEARLRHGHCRRSRRRRERARSDASIKAVAVTHNETSTGVTNDLEAIANAVRRERPDVLLLVDAISSLGSLRCRVDAWDLDVVATGSQKGWMVPPGLAMVSVSERALEGYEQAKMPRFYFDFGRRREFLAKGQTPWTPAISIFFALDVALRSLVAEGIEALSRATSASRPVHARRRQVARPQAPRRRALASNTVTAVRVPDGVEWASCTSSSRTTTTR